jgi:2-polyprenyl-3-methyl-5-hydroxy-6-metoxy-1,4-benzoquinol methylase
LQSSDRATSDEHAADQLDAWFRGGLALVLIELGRRTGVLQAIGRETWRSSALAEAAGVNERYLLEWLCAMAAFDLVTIEIDSEGNERWRLSPDFLPYLTTSAADTRAPLATTVVGAAHQMVRLVEPFCDGGGLSYAERDPTLSAAFESDAHINYSSRLVDKIVPVIPGLENRLQDGAIIADLGCGAAHELEFLAQAFPHSHFVGFDVDQSLVHRAHQRLHDRRITNVELHTKAIDELSNSCAFDVVCAFEVIHNLPDPLEALTRAREMLVDGGVFFMYETNASSQRVKDITLPWAGPIYALSLLSCLTVSLAHDGIGYGAMWGVETAGKVLSDAGFDGIGHHEVIDDPVHVVIWGSR